MFDLNISPSITRTPGLESMGDSRLVMAWIP